METLACSQTRDSKRYVQIHFEQLTTSGTMHMISKEAAYKKVEEILNKFEHGDKYIVDKNATDDYEWGWVIYYNTEAYIKKKDFEYALMGNAPFLVMKDTGKVVETGTAEPVEFYIDEYFSSNKSSTTSST